MMNEKPISNVSSQDWLLLSDLIENRLDEESFSNLETRLEQDKSLRAAYHELIALDTQLRRESEALPETGPACIDFASELATHQNRTKKRRFVAMTSLAALLCLFILLKDSLLPSTAESPEQVALVTSAGNASWLGSDIELGRALSVGEQLHLKTGTVQITYDTGAVVRLYGPTLYSIDTRNSGFLLSGKAYARAETEESHGFTIKTPSVEVIDYGTEFLTHTDLDGHSQVEVTSGEVDVVAKGAPERRHRLKRGDSLGIEAGQHPVLARIESGDGTSNFSFPTIPSPSSNDFADQAQGKAEISIVGTLFRRDINHGSGLVSVINDGRAQSARDVPEESLFFTNDEDGAIVIDMGERKEIDEINVFTWHQNLNNDGDRIRALQRFTLYGADELPSLHADSLTEDLRDLPRIAKVNSDIFFQVTTPTERPAQQGSSIRSAKKQKSIGPYRYLIFHVSPSEVGLDRNLASTFYGEIDVFVRND